MLERMDPEVKELLRRNIKLSEENNAILKKMRRGAAWSSAFRLVYWIIIIGTSIAGFYYLNPYLKSVEQTYLEVKAGAQKVNDFKNSVF